MKGTIGDTGFGKKKNLLSEIHLSTVLVESLFDQFLLLLLCEKTVIKYLFGDIFGLFSHSLSF